jgi:hypothetical protein
MKIAKTEIDSSSVKVTLENGVVIDMSFPRDNRMHLHFSGISMEHPGGVEASSFLGDTPLIPKIKSANYLDIGYTPVKKQC